MEKITENRDIYHFGGESRSVFVTDGNDKLSVSVAAHKIIIQNSMILCYNKMT